MIPGQNDYPSPDNYPVPSFTQPVPLPDIPPDEGELIYVAYNPAWIPVLMGAVDQLLLPSTWQGNHDEIIAALNEASLLKFMLQQPVEVESGVPTPFWDEASDLEDEEPAEVQEWYGYVTEPEGDPAGLTFIDDLSIWALTGFIAYSGDIGAAIFFRTIAPSFVLAWRRGDIGEIIRIIIDGAEFGRVDTASAAPGSIVQMPVVAGEGMHDITMIKVG